MSEFIRVDPKLFDFTYAPTYRKIGTILVADTKVALGGEIVDVNHKSKNGEIFKETTETAKEGDIIVTEPPNVSYIVRKEDFGNFYEINPNNDKEYRPKNFGRALRVETNVVIKAPWGEDEYIETGGVVFKSGVNGDVYGNQEKSFAQFYAREARDGSLMPLSEPLCLQLNWAMEKDETFHIKDIKKLLTTPRIDSLDSPVLRVRFLTPRRALLKADR